MFLCAASWLWIGGGLCARIDSLEGAFIRRDRAREGLTPVYIVKRETTGVNPYADYHLSRFRAFETSEPCFNRFKWRETLFNLLSIYIINNIERSVGRCFTFHGGVIGDPAALRSV